jgi:mRNA interferase MazF
MDKDFDRWNSKKKSLDARSERVFCQIREVWWCYVGVNIGSEENGGTSSFRRPVVVIQKFNTEIFFGVVLTGNKRSGKYYFHLGLINGVETSAILSQVRIVDRKRLADKLCTLDIVAFEKLKSALQRTLFGVVPLTSIEG